MEASWSKGTTEFLWAFPLVPSGTLQLVLEDTPTTRASVVAWLDGRRVHAFVSGWEMAASDTGIQFPPAEPVFDDGDLLRLAPGAQIVLAGTPPMDLDVGLLEAWSRNVGPDIPFDLSSGSVTVPEEPGRFLLLVEPTWKVGRLGWANDGSLERVRTFFSSRSLQRRRPTSVPQCSCRISSA